MLVWDDYELSEIFDHTTWIMEFLIIYLFEDMPNVHFTEYMPLDMVIKIRLVICLPIRELDSADYDT